MIKHRRLRTGTQIEAVVTDIEGTITDIAFVKDTLFAFAREAMAGFLRAHGDEPEVAAALAEVALSCGCDPTDQPALLAQLTAWMDADEKITALKTLQGMIWQAGYADGRLKGHLYADVVPVLRQWQQQGLTLYVYSSGSVAAQLLLFAHSVEGDISALFDGFFDTRIGAKRDVASYQCIAQNIAVAAPQILFLSDVAAELEAAESAGLRVAQLVRPGAVGDARFNAYQDLFEVAEDARIFQ